MAAPSPRDVAAIADWQVRRPPTSSAMIKIVVVFLIFLSLSLLLIKYTLLTPINGKISRDKCLGSIFKFLILIHSPDFLFFTPLKGVLNRVTGFQE